MRRESKKQGRRGQRGDAPRLGGGEHGREEGNKETRQGEQEEEVDVHLLCVYEREREREKEQDGKREREREREHK